MPPPKHQSNFRNHLLASLAKDDFALLVPALQPVELEVRREIEKPNRTVEYLYFVETGMLSVVASRKGKEIEIGIIGFEGVSGLPVILGNDRSPYSTYPQIAGHGHRIPADTVRAAMEKSRRLQQFLLHFAQAFMAQTAHTALANGRATIEERLAHWILMAHDRSESDDMPLTHEFLAVMLGVQRPGVTVALHKLVSRGLIRAARAHVTVLDRAGLEKSADGLYGGLEGEYRRLTGWKPLHQSKTISR